MPNIQFVGVCTIAAVVAANETAALDPWSVLLPPEDRRSAADHRAGFAEDFESFDLGPLTWSGGGNRQATIIDSGIPGFGSRTARLAAIINSGWVSTTFEPTLGVLGFDAVINSYGTLINVGTGNTLSGYVNTRVQFLPDGAIGALQTADGWGYTAPTTGTWEPGVPTRFAIEIFPTNSLNLYQDGRLIFSGHDISQEFGFAYRAMDYFRVNNFSGNQPIDILFDNISTTIPNPGSAVAFGVAGLVMLRRRR